MVDSLGDRMKGYESVTRSRLLPRTPALLRLDGKAFHTFTRPFSRPYDPAFHGLMWSAAKAICEEAMGAKVAYVQSDEITVLLTDYNTLTTEAWFGGEVQKLCSVAASVVTAAFNEALRDRFPDMEARAHFDCRAFNVPREEVANAFLWRQQDAERNSLSMLCQSHFSPKELHGKQRAAQHDLLHSVGVNWNDCPVPQRRGVCVLREVFQVEGVMRHRWVVDEEIPVFSQDRGYIERFVEVSE